MDADFEEALAEFAMIAFRFRGLLSARPRAPFPRRLTPELIVARAVEDARQHSAAVTNAAVIDKAVGDSLATKVAIAGILIKMAVGPSKTSATAVEASARRLCSAIRNSYE